MNIYKLEEKYFKLIKDLNNKEDDILAKQPHVMEDFDDNSSEDSKSRTLVTKISNSIKNIERNITQNSLDSDDSSDENNRKDHILA